MKVLKIFGYTFLSLLLVLGISSFFIDGLLLKSLDGKKLDPDGAFVLHTKDLDVNLLSQNLQLRNLKILLNDQNVLLAKKIDLRISLWPLLQKKLELSGVGEGINFITSRELFATLKKITVEQDKKNKNTTSLTSEFKIRLIDADLESHSEGKLRTVLGLKTFDIYYKNELHKGKVKSFEAKVDLQSKLSSALTFQGGGNPREYDFTGKLTKLTQKESERITGMELPFELEKGHLNGDVKAHSKDFVVHGVVSPELKNLKVKVTEDQNFIEKVGAKIVNKVFKEKGDGEITTDLPFVFDGSIEFDFGAAVKSLKKTE